MLPQCIYLIQRGIKWLSLGRVKNYIAVDSRVNKVQLEGIKLCPKNQHPKNENYGRKKKNNSERMITYTAKLFAPNQIFSYRTKVNFLSQNQQCEGQT